MRLIRIRTVIFNLVFYLNFAVQAVIFLPVLLLPQRHGWAIMRFWANSSLALHRLICGITDEVRHVERLPSDGYLLAAKHQSAWETLKLAALVPRPVFILKKELMWIPLLGWYLTKLGQIPVDRNGRAGELSRLIRLSQERIAEGCQIIIFPEGTRKTPGTPPDYKAGVSFIYGNLDCPCVPAALNSGLYWPRRSAAHVPGTVILEICEPIEPGLSRKQFQKVLQERLEPVTDRLIDEAIHKNPLLSERRWTQDHDG